MQQINFMMNRITEHLQQITSTKLLKQFNGVLLLRIFFLGSSFVVRIILARSLGTDGLGVFNFVLAWIELLVVFSSFGIPRLAVREISGALMSKEWALAHGLIRFSLRAPLILALATMVIAIVVRIASYDSMGSTLDYAPAVVLSAMLFAFGLIPVRVLILIRQGIMQALGRIESSQLPENLTQPLVFLVLIAAGWWWLHEDFSPATAMALYLISNIIALIFGGYLLRSAIPPQITISKPKYRLRYWIAAAVPLIMIKGVNILRSRTDILMLGWLSVASTVGIYSTAFQLGNLVSLPLMAMGIALSPIIVRLYKKGDMQQLQRVITRTTQGTLLLATLIALALIVFSDSILGLFGKEFIAGRTMLYLVIAGQWFSVFGGSVASILSMTDHSIYTLLGMSTGMIANIILNAVLIPIYGGEGAAFASMISMIIWNSIMAFYSWTKLKINPFPFGRFWT